MGEADDEDIDRFLYGEEGGKKEDNFLYKGY